jgi:predicted DNA-binding WGR domain protein
VGLSQEKVVYLESIDPENNRARWYRITLERSLWEWQVVREWGRIGQKGKRLTRAVRDYQEAERMIQRLLAIRKKRGYFEGKGIGNGFDSRRSSIHFGKAWDDDHDEAAKVDVLLPGVGACLG